MPNSRNESKCSTSQPLPDMWGSRPRLPFRGSRAPVQSTNDFGLQIARALTFIARHALSRKWQPRAAAPHFQSELIRTVSRPLAGVKLKLHRVQIACLAIRAA
jgi:hypothetical protein